MRVRPVELNDIPVLSELACRSFVETYAKFNTQQDMDKHLRDHLSEQSLTGQVQNPELLFYFAIDDQNPEQPIIGFFQYALGDHRKPPRSGAIEVERFYLDPAAIGRGLGSEMMTQCKETAASLGYLHLWLGVWSENHRAIQFYQRNGLVTVGEKSFVLGEEEQSDYVMEFSLSS